MLSTMSASCRHNPVPSPARSVQWEPLEAQNYRPFSLQTFRAIYRTQRGPLFTCSTSTSSEDILRDSDCICSRCEIPIIPSCMHVSGPDCDPACFRGRFERLRRYLRTDGSARRVLIQDTSPAWQQGDIQREQNDIAAESGVQGSVGPSLSQLFWQDASYGRVELARLESTIIRARGQCVPVGLTFPVVHHIA